MPIMQTERSKEKDIKCPYYRMDVKLTDSDSDSQYSMLESQDTLHIHSQKIAPNVLPLVSRRSDIMIDTRIFY